MRTTLADKSVGIRRYGPDDVPALYAAVRESISDLSRWMPWCHPDYSLHESESWIGARLVNWEAGIDYSFVVFDTVTNDFLGCVGINTIVSTHRFANLGYWVRSSCTGRGVASTSARLAARFGIEELGLGRLEIVVATQNLASQRVAEKCGAPRQGVLRNRLWLQGDWVDATMNSLVPGDFAGQASRKE